MNLLWVGEHTVTIGINIWHFHSSSVEEKGTNGWFQKGFFWSFISLSGSSLSNTNLIHNFLFPGSLPPWETLGSGPCRTSPTGGTVEDVWKKRPEHIFDRHTDVPDKTRTYIVPMDVKAPCFLLYLSLHKLPNLYGSLFVMISPPGRVKYEKPETHIVVCLVNMF